MVRYDLPALAGFSASASWGHKYLWDAALTYKNNFGDFHVVARAGYGSSNDPGTTFESVTHSGTATTYVTGGSPCISGTSTSTSLPDFRCTSGAQQPRSSITRAVSTWLGRAIC